MKLSRCVKPHFSTKILVNFNFTVNFNDFFTNIGTKLAENKTHLTLVMFLHLNLEIKKITFFSTQLIKMKFLFKKINFYLE